MAVIGIPAEFNPFHLGHYDHIAESRAKVGEDAKVVCVMSGDFVQRGEPAILPKHVRAEAAVRAGADLVIELPLPWCMASAERFASGAVGLLDSLGVVTHISFGSEAGSLAPLTALALAAADPIAAELVRERMTEGMSYAAARELVLHETVGEEARLLEQPNNILGVEYLKAIFARRSPLQPVTTGRTQTEHDSFSAGAKRSAGQLRQMLAFGQDIDAYIPGTFPAWDAAAAKGFVTVEGLETAILSRLRLMSEDDFSALPDATEGLGIRFYKAVRAEGSVSAILSAVKTKRYPLSRLRRMLLCAALGIRAEDITDTPPYARVLACNAAGRELLRDIGDKASVPVINKPAAVRDIGGEAQKIFELTAAARDFYVLGYAGQDDRRCGSDWRSGPVIL